MVVTKKLNDKFSEVSSFHAMFVKLSLRFRYGIDLGKRRVIDLTKSSTIIFRESFSLTVLAILGP